MVFLVLALVASVVVLVAVVASRRIDAWRDSRVRRARARRALDAERDSERLLEAAGYEVHGRQVVGAITVMVDGVESDFGLRADLVVSDGERRFVAEVKTGERAPSIACAATRRQLLEYSVAFDVDGVLLVDADAGLISEISF